MKKGIMAALVCLATALTLTGCNETKSVNANVESNNTSIGKVFGTSALIEIGDRLWYDTTTRIVYWWNGSLSNYGYSNTTPSPYYAPNGLPYRYNPETNTLEEIQNNTNGGTR